MELGKKFLAEGEAGETVSTSCRSHGNVPGWGTICLLVAVAWSALLPWGSRAVHHFHCEVCLKLKKTRWTPQQPLGPDKKVLARSM